MRSESEDWGRKDIEERIDHISFEVEAEGIEESGDRIRSCRYHYNGEAHLPITGGELKGSKLLRSCFVSLKL